MRARLVFALAGLLIAVVAFAAGLGVGWMSGHPHMAVLSAARTFGPPRDSAIPPGPLGEAIKRGRAIFTDTAVQAPQFSHNDLKCSNCHLDAGRRSNAAPLWGALPMFPQYRAKNGHVNPFAERIQECFLYSMNGKKPEAGDPAVVAIESYAAFLAKGAPIGSKLPGQGYPKLSAPPTPADHDRGRGLYASTCARCHGPDGQGQKAGGQVLFPPIWGPRSYNWGAGMADIATAAGFLKANMPQDKPGSLTDQQAWDIAAFIDTRPRPQDPRFTGSVAETRKKFHDVPTQAYGTTVDGVVLGGR